MSFWAGFLTGAAALWTLATAASLALAWYLNRARRAQEPNPWGHVEGAILMDGVGEDFGEDGPYDDMAPEIRAGEGISLAVPFTHTSNIGAQVKGGG